LDPFDPLQPRAGSETLEDPSGFCQQGIGLAHTAMCDQELGQFGERLGQDEGIAHLPELLDRRGESFLCRLKIYHGPI